MNWLLLDINVISFSVIFAIAILAASGFSSIFILKLALKRENIGPCFKHNNENTESETALLPQLRQSVSELKLEVDRLFAHFESSQKSSQPPPTEYQETQRAIMHNLRAELVNLEVQCRYVSGEASRKKSQAKKALNRQPDKELTEPDSEHFS